MTKKTEIPSNIKKMKKMIMYSLCKKKTNLDTDGTIHDSLYNVMSHQCLG